MARGSWMPTRKGLKKIFNDGPPHTVNSAVKMIELESA